MQNNGEFVSICCFYFFSAD